jgi:hypothetical protein
LFRPEVPPCRPDLTFLKERSMTESAPPPPRRRGAKRLLGVVLGTTALLITSAAAALDVSDRKFV